MALRNIRILGDEILKKQAKEVTEMTPKIEELIDDMFETMYDANGCGLAAPQVGIRKRIVVIDCGDQPLKFLRQAENRQVRRAAFLFQEKLAL